ncbi:MAG TPA: MMPL family transporter, partial [Thermoanaerobaculia bacterium]|nr:MMPL family transporter [Thermoanaerobaculia bacterium]
MGFPEAAGGGPAPGPLYDPAAVAAVGELERFLAARPGVGAVLGLHGHLTTARYLRSGQREGRRTVPERPEWVYQLVRETAEVRGEARRRELIDDAGRHTVVTVLLRHATYRGSAELMAAIRGYAEERLVPLGASVRLGGDVAVSQAMIPAIVSTQVTSLALALAGALAAGMLLLRSRAALAVVAPVAAAVLWILGLMGWLGVPLGVASSMFCAVTLGIGIDYAVHLSERHRQLAREGAADPALAAVATVAPAVVADAAAIALGFGVLTLSRVPANRTLGLLVAGALAVSCLLT